MKILVLMPLDERSVYMSARLYGSLSDAAKEHAFAMPMFMEYLVQSKIAPNWASSVFQAIISGRSIYRAAKDDDLIIIGNINKDYAFDVVFNFQDVEKDEEYKDVFVEKLQTIDDESLAKIINNLYESKDSKMALHNCQASGEFLSSYLKTDPHLEEIKQKYQKKIEEINDRVF